jgi:hypothetical protein
MFTHATGRDVWLRAASGGVLFLAVLAWAISGQADPDLWWHVRLGQEILATGIPSLDTYSFTFTGRELIDHEWLVEIGMAALYALGGVEALNFAFGLIAAGAFWLVYRRAASGAPTTFAMLFALVAALGSTFIFGARPQVITLWMLALVAWVIDRVRERETPSRWFWSFPLLTILWANLHGGFLAGIALMGLYAVGDLLESARTPTPNGALRPSEARFLLGIALLSFLGTALNPSGFYLWVLPFHEVSTDVSRQHILEWMRPDLGSPPFMIFGLLLGLGLVSWGGNRKRPWISEASGFGPVPRFSPLRACSRGSRLRS